MTRFEVYYTFLKEFAYDKMDRRYKCLNEFSFGNVEFETYSVYGKRFVVAVYTVNPMGDYELHEIDGKMCNVLKVTGLHGKYNGIPCIRFDIKFDCNIHKDDNYSISNLVIDLSECNLSNILQMFVHIPYFELSSYGHSYIPYKIIYPKGEHRLKPIEARGVIACKMYEDAAKAIDFSELSYADGFLMHSEITSFDFDIMDTSNINVVDMFFYGCKNLVSVKGHIKSEYPIRAYQMFAHCNKLEYVEEGLFGHSKLRNIDNIFEGCINLKNKPLSLDDIRSLEISAYEIYSGCNADDSERLFKTLTSVGCKFNAPLRGMFGVFKAGRIKVSLSSAGGIFEGSKLDVIDLSQVEFTEEDVSILEIFLKPGSALGEMRKKANINVNSSLFSGLPNILIINDTVKVMENERIIFDVVDIEGCTWDDIMCKARLCKALGGGERVLVVAHGCLGISYDKT